MISFPEEIEHYERKIYDQRQLLEISRALNSTLDYKYLINAILDICLAHVQTLSAALFLNPDLDSEYLSLVPDFKGFDLIYPVEKYNISFESTIIQYLSSQNKAYTVLELENVFDLREENLLLLKEMGAHLVVPMFAKRKIVGLILLGEKINGNEYSESERNFLLDLASLGGIAVENARLYERATQDMMTGLKNHAYFQSRLKEEREKAQKRGTSLYLLLTDVDFFKKFNDTYGHQAGDEVLKSVAKILQSMARPPFFAARYGGEEFCLVMPSVRTDEEAYTIGEKFRKLVESNIVNYEDKVLKVTVSVGIARFDPKLDAKTNKTLIERADIALYQCKTKGRNCVTVYLNE